MCFATAINCMDGCVQLPVIRHLQQRFNAPNIDLITEPGPNRILSEGKQEQKVISILERVAVSVEKHGSKNIAVAAHHDCAGNPAPKDEQLSQVRRAVKLLKEQYGDLEIIGLWLYENWRVEEIEVE